MVAFPDDYKTLVPKVLIETMATVGASFLSRINLATGDVVPETRGLAKGGTLDFFRSSYGEALVSFTLFVVLLDLMAIRHCTLNHLASTYYYHLWKCSYLHVCFLRI